MSAPLALTVAGSDSTGGAGLQADLKTFQEYGVYGLSAVTVIVAMNPADWSHEVFPVDKNTVEKQLNTAFSGKKIDAVKTGMLPDENIIELAAFAFKKYAPPFVVIDPVMVCKGDNAVLNPNAAEAVKNALLPVASVATPNLFEAGVLSGIGRVDDIEKMKEAARIIRGKGAKTVVVKGGKALEGGSAIDVFYDGKEFMVLSAKKVSHNFNHGAGCTFAAAITAGLAAGLCVSSAVNKAKDFVTAAISAGFEFNAFAGPVFHGGYRLGANGQK